MRVTLITARDVCHDLMLVHYFIWKRTNIKAKSPVQFLMLFVSDYLLPDVYSISFQRLTIGGKTGDSSDFWGIIVSSGSFYCQHVPRSIQMLDFFLHWLIIVRCRSKQIGFIGDIFIFLIVNWLFRTCPIEFVSRNPWHIWQKQVRVCCDNLILWGEFYFNS